MARRRKQHDHPRRSDLWMNRARRIARRDGGWFCHYCGDILDPTNATVDHLLAKAQGGTTHVSNLVLACLECNGNKADMTYYEFAGKYHPNLGDGPPQGQFICCIHQARYHRDKKSGGGCEICECKAWFQ